MIMEERRVLKMKKGSKTSKPTNQPTDSAAPTVSAAPVTAKSAKKKAAKSNKTTSTAPSPAPGPPPCDEAYCAACFGYYADCVESPFPATCVGCVNNGHGNACSCPASITSGTTTSSDSDFTGIFSIREEGFLL